MINTTHVVGWRGSDSSTATSEGQSSWASVQQGSPSARPVQAAHVAASRIPGKQVAQPAVLTAGGRAPADVHRAGRGVSSHGVGCDCIHSRRCDAVAARVAACRLCWRHPAGAPLAVAAGGCGAADSLVARRGHCGFVSARRVVVNGVRRQVSGLTVRAGLGAARTHSCSQGSATCWGNAGCRRRHSLHWLAAVAPMFWVQVPLGQAATVVPVSTSGLAGLKAAAAAPPAQ